MTRTLIAAAVCVSLAATALAEPGAAGQTKAKTPPAKG